MFVISLKQNFLLVIRSYFKISLYSIIFLYKFPWLIVQIHSLWDFFRSFILSLISLFTFTKDTYHVFLSSEQFATTPDEPHFPFYPVAGWEETP